MAYWDDILLGFRFSVNFLHAGVLPNPIDLRFKKVSGIEARVRTTGIDEGGQNLYTQQLPEVVEYKPLVLERGAFVGSPLEIPFQAAMTLFKFAPANVLITLLGEDRVPRRAWFFYRAFPVCWACSDLDADDKGVVIESLELAYARMQTMVI